MQSKLVCTRFEVSTHNTTLKNDSKNSGSKRLANTWIKRPRYTVIATEFVLPSCLSDLEDHLSFHLTQGRVSEFFSTTDPVKD